MKLMRCAVLAAGLVLSLVQTVTTVGFAATLSPGEDVEAQVAELRDDWVADGRAKVLTLASGTHTLARELYVDFPLTLAGATGDPADVILQGDKTFRILTINHADAEVKDLTIAKGHYGNEGQTFGGGDAGVRICKPHNLDRSNGQWNLSSAGAGGKLTHCIVTDSETTYFHCLRIVYLDGPKDKTIVDRCVIRDNLVVRQSNAPKGQGNVVTVKSGVFRNSLVTGNTVQQKFGYEASEMTPLDGVVASVGADALVANCTVVSNRVTTTPYSVVAGISATAGTVANCIVSGNTLPDYPGKDTYRMSSAVLDRRRAWDGVADCFSNCLTDTSAPINATCRATADPGFIDAAAGNYRLFTESPAVGFGCATAAGDRDLAGNARWRGDVLDCGAYALSFDVAQTARLERVVMGDGREPATVRFEALTAGVALPVKYAWDFDSDGTVDLVTDTNVVERVFQKGKYAVSFSVTNELTGASVSARSGDLLKVHPATGDGPLFENGLTGWRVLRQTNCDIVVSNAVDELVRALGLVADVTFRVADGDTPAVGDVFVGVDASLPAAGDEVVVIKAENGALKLVGNEPRAVLHAVYAFLQRELGVRWLWPGADGEFMPPRDKYEVPADLNWQHTPTIKYRGFHCCGDWYKRDEFVLWMTRNFGTVHRHGFKNEWEKKAGLYNMFSSHNADLSGNAALFAAHPEYYCELRGQRNKINICFSSDGAVDEVVKSLRSLLDSYANDGYPLDVLSIFPGDNQDYCTCALCRQMSVSTGWFSFYNKCVAKLRPDYPDVKFATIAYQGYRDVPDCTIDDTEFVEYATHGRCNFHLLGCTEETCSVSYVDHARMASWDAVGVPMGQYGYDYDVYSRHEVFLPSYSIINEVVDQAAEHHHVVLINEVGMSPRSGPDTAVNSIRNRLSELLYVRKMWDASLTLEEWLVDTTSVAFGPAATHVADYLRAMDAAWSAYAGHICILGDGINTVPKVLTPACRETATAALAAADAALDEAAAGGADVSRYRAALAREKVLFGHWTTLADQASGNDTTVYAPRQDAVGPIGEGIATSYALADGNKVATATEVRFAWCGAAPGRGGTTVGTVLVEFLGAEMPTGDGFLEVYFVSPGDDGTYAFRVGAGGEKSVEHISGTGIREVFRGDWAFASTNGVLRFEIPGTAFASVPIVGDAWNVRCSVRTGSGTIAFPAVEGMTVNVVFMNRDAADRPYLFYHGRPEHLGNPASLKLNAAENGYAMTIATNGAELAAMDPATKTFYLRVTNLSKLPTSFQDTLTNTVAHGGVAYFTSYWDMGLEKFFNDPSFKCTVGAPADAALAQRVPTSVLDDDYIRVPNDYYYRMSHGITPAYSILPADESAWTVCCRVAGKTAYVGGDHPFLMYRRYGKGIVAVGGETIAVSEYLILENLSHLVIPPDPNAVEPGDDLEVKIAEKRAEWIADGQAKVLNLQAGTYAIARELYIDFPLTLAGATGEPDDVVIEGNKTFRILTINHADAEVKDLTIAKGHYANEGSTYNWGNAGVRICKPNNLDRANGQWHGCAYGAGGKLTHCVVRDCETTYYHSWGIVYLNGPKDMTVVDRCVIRNNTHSGQENGQKGKGDIVTVESGLFRNTLVKDNTTTQTHVASPAAAYQGVVTVCGSNGEIVGCTIANNYQKNHSQHMVAGVLATAGKVINTIIAGNRIDDPTAAQDRVWHGTASCFVNCVVDCTAPINDTCVAVTDAGFVDAANGDYHLLTESAATGVGSTTASSYLGDADLDGNARLRGDAVDAGAYALTESGEKFVRFSATPNGVGNEPMRVSFAAFTAGLGSPLTYLWDFDSDGTYDVVTNENAFVYDFPMGKYSVTLTATNETSQVAKSMTVTDLLDVKIGSGTYVVDAKDGADAFQKKVDWLMATEGATAIPQTIVLKPGTYTITNEVMMTFPFVVRGETGNAADVIIDAQNLNKAFCLNHAQARLESLTVTRAKCSDINSFGVVRVCSPRGRGNGVNTTLGEGVGGLVSNVVLNACSSEGKFDGQLLLLNAGAGVVTHCVITNCSAQIQTDAASGGQMLEVTKGRADNILVANNRLTANVVAAQTDGCSPAVRVTGGTLVNATVTGNNGGHTQLCAGIQATGGKVVNALVAGNTTASMRAHYATWAGTGDNFVSCFFDCDEADLPNETCLCGADAKFLDPAACDYRIVKESPCRDVGTNDVQWIYGDTDLAGLPRQRTVGEETTIDLGAYQYDPEATAQSAVCTLPDLLYDNVTVRLVATVGGFGTDPVFYWDFDGDGVTDLVTHQASFDQVLGVGAYDLKLVVSNLVDGVGKTAAVKDGQFAVTPHPVHYVDVNGKNPVSPYLTSETAATNIQDAVDVAEAGHEVLIAKGVYEMALCLNVSTDRITVHGATGNPEDVIVRATSGKNRCLRLNAGPKTFVHSMTFENGRGGDGDKEGLGSRVYGAGVVIANIYQQPNKEEAEGTALGGVLSNCVVRSCINGTKFTSAGGVYANGVNALVTHCVITNNASSGGYQDNGNFSATGLMLAGGARGENCLVADNRSGTAGDNGYYQAAVCVGADSVLRYSTVVRNRSSLVGGVNVSGSGRFEKCVIADNTLTKSDTTNPRHRVWGAFSFSGIFYRLPAEKHAQNLANEATRAADVAVYGLQTTNAVDLVDSGLGAGTVETTAAKLIKNAEKRDYRLAVGSPAKDRVAPTDEKSMPSADLLGNPRLDNGLYDLGAFESVFRGLMLIVK